MFLAYTIDMTSGKTVIAHQTRCNFTCRFLDKNENLHDFRAVWEGEMGLTPEVFEDTPETYTVKYWL